MSEEKVRTEEFQVSGDMLVAKIKELVHEGNIRRVIIKDEQGKTLIDIPLTLGVVGALAASATIFAFTSAALFSVIWFSSAAGISTSHSSFKSSSPDTSSAPLYPFTDLVLFLCSSTL